MKICPEQYTKLNFIELLKNSNVDEIIIKKMNKLPETINVNGNEFNIYINVTKYGIENPKFNYELNYYSEDIIEFLFYSKVFNDIELSLNNLLCNLVNIKVLNIEELIDE